MSSTDFQDALLAWYRAEARDLPWRRAPGPYAVLVSEFMLQQTTVAAVVPFFERWMQALPTFEALAQATEPQVMGLWQGLGYYRRARALRAAAAEVVRDGLPQDAVAWQRLPGVGPYTAAAVASIAQGQAVPVVDGNVERVFARLVDDPSEGAALRKGAWTWAASVLQPDSPGEWNQALMELGASVCRPRNPSCDACPVASHCRAKAGGTVSMLPARRARAVRVEVRFYVAVVERGGRYAVRPVPPGDWWLGLWEFPRTAERPEAEKLGEVRSVVTRHQVVLEVFIGGDADGCEWLSPDEVDALPLSSPMRRVWNLVRQRDSTSRTTGKTTLPSSR